MKLDMSYKNVLKEKMIKLIYSLYVKKSNERVAADEYSENLPLTMFEGDKVFSLFHLLGQKNIKDIE